MCHSWAILLYKYPRVEDSGAVLESQPLVPNIPGFQLRNELVPPLLFIHTDENCSGLQEADTERDWYNLKASSAVEVKFISLNKVYEVISCMNHYVI